VVDREGFSHLPVGVFGQAGMTWAAQPNDAQGNNIVPGNGIPQAYAITGEIATKVTNFLGVFGEYQIGNTFPGWKGTSGPMDIRAVHFFHLGNTEILAGIDVNNNPTLQDVWNSTPDWGFPFYSSPEELSGPASPMITSLGAQATGVGAYALVNRQFYFESSFYRVATGPFRFMSAGTSFQAGGVNYLDGYNPYWRAYWDRERGPHSLMIGTFNMRARVFPDSSNPAGPVDTFQDYGFDSQYQHLGVRNKVTVRGSYIYERRDWSGSFPLGTTGLPKGNLKSMTASASYAYDNAWTFHAGYFLSGGNDDSTLYGISDPSGNEVTASPKTAGYNLQIDRQLTQNVQLMAQYRGFLRFDGLRHDIDGLGRNAADNNTLWMSLFFAF
jgi:hypothetical protein